MSSVTDTSHSTPDIPLACDMTAIPAEERTTHELLSRRLWAERPLEKRELPDGYAYRFSSDDLPTVMAFIANERLCCSFFNFTLEVPPQRGPIWLTMTGGPGVKGLLAAAIEAVTSS